MIAILIIIGLTFAWLGYETDWMRVRLPIGQVQIIETIPDIVERYVPWDNWNHCHWPSWFNFTDPICGWEWIKSREHIIPECRLEMTYGGVHHTMTIKDTKIIKLVVTAMKSKPKPYVYRPLWHRNKAGGFAVPVPARSSK